MTYSAATASSIPNLALTYDGQALPAKYGYPVRLRIPTKPGCKTRSTSAPSTSPTPTLGATGKTRGTTGSGAAESTQPL